MENTEKDVRVRVAELIRRQYRAMGISRGKFAQELGITERSVGYWSDGTSQPKREVQHLIEEMFGWPKGSISTAIASGLSGAPLDGLEIEQKPVSDLGGVPAASLADELLARLRASDEEIRRLRSDLAEAKAELAPSQPDLALAAHRVEPSMVARRAAEARFSDEQESP